jgi:hypothetical protein
MASYDLTQLIGFNFNGVEINGADIANATAGDPSNVDYVPGSTTYNITANDWGFSNQSDDGNGPNNVEELVTAASNGTNIDGTSLANPLALGQIVLVDTDNGFAFAPQTFDVLGFSADGTSILIGDPLQYNVMGVGANDPYGGATYIISNMAIDTNSPTAPYTPPALTTFTTTNAYTGGPFFEAGTAANGGDTSLTTVGTNADVVTVSNALVGKLIPANKIITTVSGTGVTPSGVTANTAKGDGGYILHYTQTALGAGAQTFTLASGASAGPEGQPTLKLGANFYFQVVGFNSTQILLNVTSSTGVATTRYDVLSISNDPPVLSTSDLMVAFQNYGPAPIAGAAYPCFASGTHIATPTGAVAVESLKSGDLVLSAFGGAVPVVWLGHRTVQCDRHPRRQDVDPVTVSAGAFGPGLPVRDLVLSPDHSVYVDGVLIPVRYLVNGATIRQVRVPSVTYWHVELPAHDVVLAEGLPAESYLDTGNRGAFANGGGAVQLHPDFSLRVWEAEACAELVVEGPRLTAVRKQLVTEAGSLGFALTADPDLRFEVDGIVLAASLHGGRYCVDLPAQARQVRLLSRSAVPAEVSVTADDHRRLGVAVSRITHDGRPIRLRSRRLAEGWHGAEGDGLGWRWTHGAAVLMVPSGGRLAVTVAMAATYWMKRMALDTAGSALMVG